MDDPIFFDIPPGDVSEATALGAVRAACLAELCWVGAEGPTALPVVPLVLGRRPAVALPYAEQAAARSVASAGSAVLCVTDPRMAGTAWRPLAVGGRATVVDDLDGQVFTGQLLEQELRKHPPSRVLADSPLLRRENWWYVPRVVVELEIGEVVALPPRTEPSAQAVLVTAAGSGARADVVSVADWSSRPLRVEPADGRRELPGTPGPAALLATDASVPDVERWTRHLLTGRWDPALGAVQVESGPGAAPRLPPPLGLWARWRRQRAVERACRAGIAAAEAAARGHT